MKQLLQNIKDGKTLINEAPVPQIDDNSVIIKTSKTLISSGTEKILVNFGKQNFISKIKNNPDKVKDVYNKYKTDGFLNTINAVNAKLDQPIPLGYCNVGKVIEIGSNVKSVKLGDRVLSNGQHAEYVKVFEKQCAAIPNEVSDNEAVYGVLGSISLHSVRLLKPTIGETFVVYGSGLTGLLASQILQANGCRVISIDINNQRNELAKKLGALSINPQSQSVESFVMNSTNNLGADGVIISTATTSDEIINQSARILRKRGRIVLLGTAGLNINRNEFYKKEITFQVSCSYGPGRYDINYEEENNDYPLGFVRWTQQRNFQTILNLIKEKKINTNILTTSSYAFKNISSQYSEIINDPNQIGVIIEYEHKNIASKTISVDGYKFSQRGEGGIGLIGAGNYSLRTLIPNLKKLNLNLDIICSENSTNASILAKKFKINTITSDYKQIIENDNIKTIFVSTRHNNHSKFLIESIKNNKNIFLEKPLAIKNDEIEQIKKIIKQKKDNKEEIPKVVVGYNRRFSNLTKKLTSLIHPYTKPMTIIATINAGFISDEHWTQNLNIGGGRIIGEACHFIDLMLYLTKSRIKNFKANNIFTQDKINNFDNFSVNFLFENGSLGVLNYLSSGHKSYPKERIEVFCDNKNYVIDNFFTLKAYGNSNFNKQKLWLQDKGHLNIIREFMDSLDKKNNIIKLDEIIHSAEVSININNHLRFNEI